MKRKPTTPTITLPQLSKLLGEPERTFYRRYPEARGPLPLDQAITWIEGNLRAFYAAPARARKIRRYEDAVRELRVQRALHRIEARPKRRQRAAATYSTNLGYSPSYDPESGALLSAAIPSATP